MSLLVFDNEDFSFILKKKNPLVADKALHNPVSCAQLFLPFHHPFFSSLLSLSSILASLLQPHRPACCNSNTACSLLPQDLCTGCSFWLECSSPDIHKSNSSTPSNFCLKFTFSIRPILNHSV